MSSIKQLAYQIKKIADMPEVPSYDDKSQVGHIGNGLGQPANKPIRKSIKSKAVMDMQLALQHLSQVIASSIQYDKMVAALSGKKQESQDELQGQYGKDAFSNFMVNTYLRNSPVKGVELDPAKHNIHDKQPSELKNMYVILENLRQVGSSKNESFADGDWGPRTNNALKNVVAIASSVVNLGSNLGMNFGNFNPEEIVQLADPSLVPDDEKDITQEQKDERAPVITKILNTVSALFIDFKNQVLNNPAFSNIMHGLAPVLTLNKVKQNQEVDAQGEEKAILGDLKTNGAKSQFVMQPNASFSLSLPYNVINPRVKNVSSSIPIGGITAADLISSETFNTWIKNNHLLSQIQSDNPQNWQQVIMTILDQVKSQVAQQLGGK